jgi:acyl-[acyl-carrier-protein] desaturase
MSKSFTDVELIHEPEPVVETGVGGVYDLRQHLNDVGMQLPRKRRIFEADISAAKVNAGRDDLAATIEPMDREAVKFEESKVRYFERESRRAASEAATLPALVN